MPILVTCTECGKQLRAPDTAAGKKVKCPACQTILIVPSPFVEGEEVEKPSEEFTDSPPARRRSRREDEESDDEPQEGGGRRPCPMCGEMIPATAAKCRFCGEIFDPELKDLERKKKRKRSSADSDMTTGDWLLAILCSGIGCIVGVVWLIQGKPKGGKMLGVSILFAILWNILNVILQTATHH